MKRRRWILCLMAGLICGVGIAGGQTRPAAGRSGGPMPRHPVCQIVDRPSESLFDAEVAYLYRADVEHAGRAGFLELGTRANLAYFRLPFGDIDFRSDFRGTWINDSGSIDLPNQLFMLRMPLTWTGRYPDGLAGRVTLKPGYYGSGENLGSDELFMPVAFSFVRSFTPEFSGVAGLEFRNGFYRQWFPIFGAVWQPNPTVRIEALLPRGTMSLALGRDWLIHAGYVWESLDYRLDDERRQLTIEDLRFMIGATRVMHSELEFTAEIGTVTGRRLKFHRPSGNSFDPDAALFINFAVAAPF